MPRLGLVLTTLAMIVFGTMLGILFVEWWGK